MGYAIYCKKKHAFVAANCPFKVSLPTNSHGWWCKNNNIKKNVWYKLHSTWELHKCGLHLNTCAYIWVGIRCLVGSTGQAFSSGFYIKIAWKINRTTLFSSKSFPLISAGPQKPQKLNSLKIKNEKFGPKFFIPCWKMDILVP